MYIELGRLTALTWRGGSRRWSLERAPALVVKSERLLIVYPEKRVGRAPREAERIYRGLHWGEPSEGNAWTGVVGRPPFVALGVGLTITYTTAKGERELSDWVHEWGEGARGAWRPPTVVRHVCQLATCAARGTFALRGGTYHVTDRGIVG